ncbi:hypothetical protein [Hyalangium versicolor]|uniref:hypothetical protein n=1 Tax=Hyalangium versicolor TaxID=2861190 RepID=UPI001CD003C5|nr:hypothetical protein [Hyalangium versicolor]
MFGIIPVQLDLGWFLSPRVYLGTSFQYSHVLLANHCAQPFEGVEFVNLQGGTDFRISEELWLGPFVTFTVGKYMDVDEARFHGWLMGGLRLSTK